MRKFLLIGLSLLCAILAMTSCKKTVESPETPYVPEEVRDLFGGATPTGYYSYAEMSVPAGTEVVYIEYKGTDGSVKTVAQAVTPEVAVPTDGRDVEPFGTVKLLFQAPASSQVSVYYKVFDAATKADSDDAVYTLENFPIDQKTSGEFGKTRYVQVQWNFAWMNNASTGYQNAPSYPKDVVMYDAEHNHTLRYTYVYNINGNGVSPEGYVLTDAYNVEDHIAISYKYNYCGGCGNCPFCMPWGCSCGCGSVNSAFQPNGNQVDDAVDDGATTETPTVPEDIVPVKLQEPAPYVTTDEDYTMYHSSGVVMFDDSWPNLPATLGGTGNYDFDFNDVVVDYDIEALTVADAQLKSQGWREQVKVVLHLRAVGGSDAWRVGMALENFNMDFVESVDEYKTLDSWQNPHGELPSWTERTLQENSLHYDPLSGTQYTGRVGRPSIEIGGLQRINGNGYKGAGSEVYYYIKDGQSTPHVMNPALKEWDQWQDPRTEQYDEVMAAVTVPENLAKIQARKFYNTIPGYVNQTGGLYTYTVIYKTKDRSKMTPEQSQKCLANMIDAVVNTTAQNFFIVTQDWRPIGLKGYLPLDYKTKDNHIYSEEYQKKIDGKDILDPSVPYVSKTGQVWAFKCPTLTRHIWEKQSFAKAYPLYEGWVTSGGTQNANWYKLENADVSYLSCEW
ncbi:MAG: DUF4842 domain-containing protein [Bacteroidales bacterium]|nr:DUF4842 domain-containing protein [Bacteroidales bacterium]